MEFSFLGLKITINRKSKESALGLDGIKVINDDSLRYIRNLSSKELARRSSLVSFPSLEENEKIKCKLDSSGIVIIENFLSSEQISIVNNTVTSLLGGIEKFINSNVKVLEEGNVLYQMSNEKLKSYSELANYEKTVVSVREGQDKGMVDVFNADYAFKELRNELRACYEDSSILSIIYSGMTELNFKNLNFYINNEVSSTRGFHVDSFTKQLKAFIYLTDCLSLDDGPYTYVEGSHRYTPYRSANKAISANLPNKTECPLIDHQKIIPVLGKAGSLVISDQSGFHRGFPQSEGHNRVVSVMNVTS
ncbi:phytanoyl-CoA dioxygenase family protein [Idiomarina sp.]|uniref:phytanoyl-CoA dioxygenase family protein n=1 Tax=Idiomarina sp. TaxID=1874361 RepID=UPI003A957501